MENLSAWWEEFAQSFGEAMANLREYFPVLLATVAVMLFGWLVAKLLRAALIRSGGAVHRLFERLGRPLSPAGLKVSQRLVALSAHFVFWVIILLFAAMASRVAGLEAFSDWLDRLVDYLPTLIAGLLIAFAGYLLSSLVRDVVAATFVSVGSKSNEIAGLVAQATVFVTALVIGLDQIGIDVTFLIILAAVLLGGTLLSMALAFGLGAREFVGNAIAAHELRGTLEVGDTARLGGVEGRVLEITQTMVVLINEQGRYLVPASRLQKAVSAIITEDGDE